MKQSKKIKFFFFFTLLNKRKGTQKRVIDIKLKVYVPIDDNICIISNDHDQV